VLRTRNGAYRSEDPVAQLERCIHASETALADLRIEQAILTSRAEVRARVRARWARRLGFCVALLALDALFTWVLLGSVPLMVLSFALIGAGWGLLFAIDTIKPSDRAKGRPPNIP
jgi:hypothetical protein